MPEQLTPSQSAWTLLDMLQQQLGVSIELLDVSRRPIPPPGAAESRAGAEDPSAAAEILKSIRTGEVRILRGGSAPVGIFPLRLARQVVGCLVVTSRMAQTPDLRVIGEANVESCGHLARTALEADLALGSQLTEARRRTRRVHAFLRFLTQLGGSDAERDVMHAVIQAAVVWFDADCRIYQRYPDGSYVLSGALPAVDVRQAPTIDAVRAAKLTVARRFAAGGDLEDLGMGGRQQESLVLGVGSGPAPPWLLVLSGAIDQEVDLTFAAIARVLEGHLLARDVARLAGWQARLSQVSVEGRHTPERVLRRMLEALGECTGASSASLVLETEGRERVLAALGAPTGADAAGEAATPPLELTVPAAPGARVRLTLAARTGPHEALRQTESWMTALRPWLHHAAGAFCARDAVSEQVSEIGPFERRIQEEVERAKRFNLGLGLVVIEPVDGGQASLRDVLEAVRSELRASDLVGQMRSGQVAVLLVHAEPVSADSVLARIRRRLATMAGDRAPRPVQLGRALFSAECASADALIAQAQRTAERFESRN